MRRTSKKATMTLTAANASLNPGWKIVRQSRQFALLWQSRQVTPGRYKVLAIGSLREVVAAYNDLTRPVPGATGDDFRQGQPSDQKKDPSAISEVYSWFTEGFDAVNLKEGHC
jgi:hypothetical protein